MAEQLYPWGRGTPKVVYVNSTNDSDVTLTVPAGKLWRLLWLAVGLTTTATVGNRSLHVYLTDGTNIIWKTYLGANIAASQVGTLYLEPDAAANATARPGPGASNSANVSATYGIPDCLLLPAGSTIRVYDRSAIDPAADDMLIGYGILEWDA
jgi:hypothetical protein